VTGVTTNFAPMTDNSDKVQLDSVPGHEQENPHGRNRVRLICLRFFPAQGMYLRPCELSCLGTDPWQRKTRIAWPP
jgi:hypothetical protein